MDKKKSIFFGAILIDIALIFLAYLVFYEKLFDEDISILLTWIVVIGITFMMIVTIGLAITIPRKKHIRIRRKRKRPKKEKEEQPPLKEVESKEGEETEELPEFKAIEEVPVKTVEKQGLEHTTTKSGITTIRRVTQEDLDEIEERVDESKSDFKDEIQHVIDMRAKEVEETVDDIIHSKIKKSEKLVSQNEIKTTEPVKIRRKAITNEEKAYIYLRDHPQATASDVRKAVGVGCKLSSAKRYRSLWLKNEGN